MPVLHVTSLSWSTGSSLCLYLQVVIPTRTQSVQRLPQCMTDITGECAGNISEKRIFTHLHGKLEVQHLPQTATILVIPGFFHYLNRVRYIYHAAP